MGDQKLSLSKKSNIKKAIHRGNLINQIMSYQITSKTTFTSLKALEQKFFSDDPSYDQYTINATIIKKLPISKNQNEIFQILIIYDGTDTMRLILHNDFISAYSQHLKIGYEYQFINGFLREADAYYNCCSISCTMNSGHRNRTQLKFKEVGLNFGGFIKNQESRESRNLAITDKNSDNDQNEQNLEKISNHLTYNFIPLSQLETKSKTDILDVTATILKIGEIEEYEVKKFARRLTLIDSTSFQVTCLFYDRLAETFTKRFNPKTGDCIILKNVRTYEHPFIGERVIQCSEVDTIVDVKQTFENRFEYEFSWWNHVGQFQNKLEKHAADIRKGSRHRGFERAVEEKQDVLQNFE